MATSKSRVQYTNFDNPLVSFMQFLLVEMGALIDIIPNAHFKMRNSFLSGTIASRFINKTMFTNTILQHILCLLDTDNYMVAFLLSN